MKSYFFVPGSRLHKISEMHTLSISEIIIDLEDAIKFSERKQILEELKSKGSYKNFYIRIPLYNENEKLEISFLEELYVSGFRKFVFPKIQKASDFDILINGKEYSDIEIILLVETARFFLEVKDVFFKYGNIFSGIGLGSHDFMSEVGGDHDLKNLEYVRLHILYLARMINIEAIDIASMELKDKAAYKDEILDGFRKGYDAKFFIHPWQINTFKSISLYSENELVWAKKIKNELVKVGGKNEFNPIVVDGQIIERPHLAKAEKIIKYYETK